MLLSLFLLLLFICLFVFLHSTAIVSGTDTGSQGHIFPFLLLENNNALFLLTEACPVKSKPSRAIVKYGDPFTANCSLLSDEVEGMGWESSIGGIPLQLGVPFLLLTIPKVNDWNFEPACFINHPNGTQCERLVNITVYSK